MDRDTIFREIEANFSYIIQWAKYFDYERASYFSSKAEGLIELLEKEDCRSMGGYDNKNPNNKVCDNPLYNRFITLCKNEKQKGKRSRREIFSFRSCFERRKILYGRVF